MNLSLWGVVLLGVLYALGAVGVVITVFLAVGLFVAPQLVTFFLQKKCTNGRSSKANPQKSLAVDPEIDYTFRSAIDEDYDVILIGGGVVGASAGIVLGRMGRKVLIIERHLDGDVDKTRIIGELLQPSGVQKLQNLGLRDSLDHIDAQPVTGYNIYYDSKEEKSNTPSDDPLHLLYPSVDNELQKGFGFHNYKFVNRLRQMACNVPSVEIRQGTVKKLVKKDGRVVGVQYTTKDGNEVEKHADLTILCDGCSSSFRKEICDDATKQTRSKFLGMILRDCPQGTQGHTANVVLSDPTPVLFYPIDKNESRILIDFPGKIPRADIKQHLLEKVYPQMPNIIKKSFSDAVEREFFRVMPNQYMGARPKEVPGLVGIGDVLNMRHPLTGAGMTVAFTDVELLCDILSSVPTFADHSDVDRAISDFYERRKIRNSTLNILACALYGVTDVSNPDLQKAFHGYVKQQGQCSEGPMRLLSGVSRDQTELLCHFFSVAGYGVQQLLSPIPTPGKLLRSYRLLRVAANIVYPLVWEENTVLSVAAFCFVAKFVLFIKL